MSKITNAKAAPKLPAATRWAFVFASLALAVACGDPSPATAPPFTGTGGSGSSAGTGGMSGTGGVVGSGGMSGTGASSGTGGTAGGGAEGCVTSALCDTCLTNTCSVDSDCLLESLVCVPTGCTLDGEPQKECQPARYISCDDPSDCGLPDNQANYDCKSVDGGPSRCVRRASGCLPETEDYDCPPGFSCEGGACVDRRVPCNTFADCPKNHVCFTVQNATTSSFCVSVFRSCHVEADCSFLGSDCADVDGDGRTECAGELDGTACVNADDCAGTSDPVCEAGVTGTTAVCGDYGLCLSDSDCDVAKGFSCVGLWQDGRKECVRAGGTCDQVTDCDLQQVCAAPRNGGFPPRPSCQAGTYRKEAT